MLKINSTNLPKLIVNDLTYLIYYSIYGFLLSFFLIIPTINHFSDTLNIKSDYVLFIYSIIFWTIIGIFLKFSITPIEKKIIKRNIFVAGLIQVLKKHKSITFKSIMEDHAYFVFQSRKVLGRDTDWSAYIEALIALWVIELKNHKALNDKCKDFDYKQFNKKLFEAELVLKDKKVDVDELIKRLDNYVL